MAEVFVIAEAGVNHNGDLAMALQLVDAAVEAGADAVKFQAFSPEHLVTATAAKAGYQDRNDPRSTTQRDMLKGLSLSAAAFRAIRDRCRDGGIEFLCSPFDQPSLEMLVNDLHVTRLKFGSGELTNAPLLWNAARSGLPLILSTGMADLEDIELALGVVAHALGIGEQTASPTAESFLGAAAAPKAHAVLRSKVTLLHAVSDYPAELDTIHLLAMARIRERFALPVGYSDHTQGVWATVAAAALGATMIEKHFTLDRTMKGPDHQASLEPDELTEMIRGIRAATLARGEPVKTPQPSEMATRVAARKSLVAATSIPAGQPLSAENMTTKRPGGGMQPVHYWRLLGHPASRDYGTDDWIDEPIG